MTHTEFISCKAEIFSLPHMPQTKNYMKIIRRVKNPHVAHSMSRKLKILSRKSVLYKVIGPTV